MRTWEENKQAINQLWPRAEFTNEERKLWNDDLGSLDQSVLYDAIRNVKRNTDTLYPHIKWFREEYRGLHRVRKFSEERATPGAEPRKPVVIDAKTNDATRETLREWLSQLVPADYQQGIDCISQHAHDLKIGLETAYGLNRYLQGRLGLLNGGHLGEDT